MSGKAYSLREMKVIVDYLTTNNLYSETRGRKMWIDFANTNLTIRTWQSLKETFLKRILPDISNPYYKLDTYEILSFKRGVNLTQKDTKLTIVPANESKKNVTNGDKEQPSTSKNNEENATGEDTQCSKVVHDRASTETLILDTCYQTAEDIQRDLESSDEEETKNKSKPAVKSVRDFIEYSEPLTPMLQEVLDDFATDEDCSDTEPPMQIDENYVAQDEVSHTPDNVPASQSILAASESACQDEETTKKQKTVHNGESLKASDETAFSKLDEVTAVVDKDLVNNHDKKVEDHKESQNKEGNSHESSIALTDSLLPNNQEEIETHDKFGTNSPLLPMPQVNHRHKNKNKEENKKEEEILEAVNTVSDETDKMDFEGPIEVDSNEQKANNNEPPNQKHNMMETSRLNIPNKPYLSDDKVHEIHSNCTTENKEIASQLDNPCLQSVSLYATQIGTAHYSDSDCNNKVNTNDDLKTKEDQKKDDTKQNEDQNDKVKEHKDGNNEEAAEATTTEKVILLNSRTTSETVDDSVSDNPLARSSLTLKMRKDKKIASVFGFSNGAVAKSRKFAGRKKSTSHRSLHSRSDSYSSEWTSTSDDEYVSPPQGRRHRYPRKYLKPRSARIMSLDEEGGLFVMLGKRIYPLVKDGKAVKNYVTYLPESDPEEDESYWKSKYIDERKRTEQLKKKLGKSRSNGALDKEEKESSVSLSSVSVNHPKVPQSRQESINGNEVIRLDSDGLEKSSKQETLKIKFTKNDQEVQLEGHWQHINPVLAQVVSMLHKAPSETKQAETVASFELSSGDTTPVVTPTEPGAPDDTGVHDKINEIESVIFKEIEEKDGPKAVIEQQEEEKQKQGDVENSETIEDDVEENEPEQQVTQRRKRGRPKKDATPAASTAERVAKKPRKSTGSKINVETLNAQEINDGTRNLGRLTKSPWKLLDGITEVKRIRKSTVKAQPEAPVEIPDTPITEDIDEEVRYKFPSPAPERPSSKSYSNKNTSKNLPNITSPDSLSRHSVNSSQGYQDSDSSPFNIGIRRRRRLSISTLSIQGKKMQRKKRSKSFPLLRRISSESSTSFNISVKPPRRGHSTINSEVYQSESYRLLIPHSRRIMKTLESIEETNPSENDSLMDRIRDLHNEILQATVDPTNKNEPASSSSLSLPLSPELSIVENLSINQNEIADNGHPTINEIQGNTAQNTCNNEYRLSQVDVSMPLMAQNCALQESYKKHIICAMSNLCDAPNSAGRNLSNNSSMKFSMASESILKNISTTNISSDSLDRRLEQLLLESAKKPPNQNNEEKMEVDTTVKKKTGSRKRCSTPHKKNAVRNKRKSSEPIVEEESTAHCSRGGRRSCPPTVNIAYHENALDDLQINILDESIKKITVIKGKRIKKDIIKVKIGRPKDKPKKKSKSKTPNVSQNSAVTEVENESGVFLQGFDDSGDLIHNHTETCLQIEDCMSESVEFIETTTKSIISLSSSLTIAEEKENLNGNSTESRKSSPELFCGNAQCARNLHDVRATDVKSVDSGNTVYFTPFLSRCNSVMTEDLSEPRTGTSPVKSSNWYLFSDDETNTNYFDVHESNDTPSYGANLNQLFPITCAVPDLSTITEMSERNDSQKASLDAGDLKSKTGS